MTEKEFTIKEILLMTEEEFSIKFAALVLKAQKIRDESMDPNKAEHAKNHLQSVLAARSRLSTIWATRKVQ